MLSSSHFFATTSFFWLQLSMLIYHPSHLVEPLRCASFLATEFFEYIAQKINPKLAVNWICVELFSRLNKKSVSFEELPIKVAHFVSLLQLIVSFLQFLYINDKNDQLNDK